MAYNGGEMIRYNPKEIEVKWQKRWEEQGTYQADFDSTKPKYVGFGMFNYPSGAGIHVGHVRNYTIPDVVTRAKRQQGYESYQPVGWDSFGLPAENYAIKTGVSPQASTVDAIKKYHKQYRAMGWGVDWSKEINTIDPAYYKWTQWAFLKLFENSLAYQKESPQWWCEQCMTVLADEQVLAGKCWRHDNPDDPQVSKKSLRQWFFKITDYADEMLEATDELDWTPSVKASQKSWIGRSEGAEIQFQVDGLDEQLRVFTTRPDTLFGATFMVLAPEHPLVESVTITTQKQQVNDYVKQAQAKTEIERQESKEKTGVFTGGYVINPANDKKIPIWVADYVLMGYGSGAIMAVPGQDERDWQFAEQHDLEIIRTVEPPADFEGDAYVGDGPAIESSFLDGLMIEPAKTKMIDWLEANGVGRGTVTYKMRDWLISRQRYWGAPIPIIHCDACGPVAVPEADLPVELPKIDNYQPTGGSLSVLADVDDWVNVPCPNCDRAAKRETDTMDGYVCSSWYFLRYLSPHDNEQAWDVDRLKKWMPIDFYNGGDHATAHLLYARFFTRFFHSLGLIPTPEPFSTMVFNGKVRASDGSNFSKSKGNGIDPIEVIESGYGADALRLYEMFAAPVELDVLWDPQGIPGAYRFLNRVWMLTQDYLSAEVGDMESAATAELDLSAHRMVKKVSNDIDNYKLNTAIAAMMEATNSFYKLKEAIGITASQSWEYAIEALLQVLAPFAPHISEELWEQLGHKTSIHVDNWPTYSEAKLMQASINVAVQVNGKVRATITVPADSDEQTVVEKALANERVQTYLTSRYDAKKIIYVYGKLVNFVV